MQERHMNDITSKHFGEQFNKKLYDDAVFENAFFKDKEVQIKTETTNLPAGMRTPTDAEIRQMGEFAAEYRKKKPKASEREIRRATQRKFSVHILPNTP